MKRYSVHIALGLGLTILLGGCGLLMNVAPAGGVPLNQPISTTVPPTPSFTAPEGLSMPDPSTYAMLFEDGSGVDLQGKNFCLDWWPCDDRAAEVELRATRSCEQLLAELVDANNTLKTADTEWNRDWFAIVEHSMNVKNCP